MPSQNLTHSWYCVHSFVQILEEFHNIFGPELKAVTGDPKRIDDVLGWVNSLVVPIQELNFDPFNIRKMGSWKMVMQDFKTKVQVGKGVVHGLFSLCCVILYSNNITLGVRMMVTDIVTGVVRPKARSQRLTTEMMSVTIIIFSSL